MKAIEKIWILGDNFIAETYRKNFKKAGGDEAFFMKKHYDISPFCSSKYNDKNNNVLSRIQHSLAAALNSKAYLPSYILVVLNDNLIEYLQFKRPNVATFYGTWMEFLSETVQEMLKDK